MTDATTISYYNTNAAEYAQYTYSADMTECYERFLKYVPCGGSIADIGCGGGRDMKYFWEHGYDAAGIDASSGLCPIAAQYSGCPVECTDFLAWEPGRTFDAFWANASLLHLKENEILQFFRTKSKYVKKGGTIYFSMKAGNAQWRNPDGRFFTPFSEELLESILASVPAGKVLERWSNVDRLGRENLIWETVILQVNTSCLLR